MSEQSAYVIHPISLASRSRYRDTVQSKQRNEVSVKLQIPLTDKANYNYMRETRHRLDKTRGIEIDEEMSQPVILFFNGDAAYELVSDKSIDGFGLDKKYDYYFELLQQSKPIDISLIDTVRLDKGLFRISDGRHRAIVFALRKAILSQNSAGPAAEPELYEKEPVPFLTFRDAAEIMKSKGWLVPPSADFDLLDCSSQVYF